MWDSVAGLLARVADDVVGTLVADWPYLLASILTAAVLTVYVGTERVTRWLRRRRWSAITGSVALATLTPFCSCGTTAVVLGMLATEAPWAPIVAFMVVSPLTSPSELLLSIGLFGWPFALLYFAGATALGLAAGWIAGRLDDRGWLAGQARMTASAGACASEPATPGCGAAAGPVAVVPTTAQRLRLRRLGAETWRLGTRVSGYFLAYTTLGYLLIELVPTASLMRLLSADQLWGVPVAAMLGIPIYLSTEASLPMVAALVHGGMDPGPAMAFLITGAGTSVGAISGALVIARRRVVGLVVAILLGGAVILGWLAALVLG